MSFETLKKEDLLKIADDFGVDVKPSDTKAVIIAAFDEDGVTWADVAKIDQAVADKDAEIQAEKEEAGYEKVVTGPKQLLRMDRENSTYEIRGYKFTKENPFGIVSETDAEWITDNVEGFRYATPREAQVYYG